MRAQKCGQPNACVIAFDSGAIAIALGDGKGGFGLVYLAHDDKLQRLVAIKVPHARLIANTSEIEAYLSEARMVANLDYSHIVPVYDVGGTDEFPCYVVSKYIDGTDLAQRIKQSRPTWSETVELVAKFLPILPGDEIVEAHRLRQGVHGRAG